MVSPVVRAVTAPALLDPAVAIWPERMRPLLAQHGAALLNDASLEALGYPALLITEHYEIRALLARIEKRQEQSPLPTSGDNKSWPKQS
jgi:hypothetical protein